uniref:N/A n=1 Tax=Ganoderma boninense TaxID=34458 RepID=A0A5K1K5I7_9APHY|nr:N/A [Ganoderma boninense]
MVFTLESKLLSGVSPMVRLSALPLHTQFYAKTLEFRTFVSKRLSPPSESLPLSLPFAPAPQSTQRPPSCTIGPGVMSLLVVAIVDRTWMTSLVLPAPPFSSVRDFWSTTTTEQELHEHLAGNFPELSQRQTWKLWDDLAEEHGTVSKLHGMFGARIVLLHDPKALYHIFIKDQEFWPKGLNPSNDFSVLLGPGVLSSKGEQHRRQRKLLNPVFSAAHLRNMTHIFYGIAHKLRQAIASRLPADGTSGDVLDVNGWMARTTLEMLGQAGLGYSFDDFEGDATDAFGESLKMFFPESSLAFIVSFTVQALSYVLPDWIIRRILRATPTKQVQKIMDISDVIVNRSKDIIAEKRETLLKGDVAMAHQVGEGKDLMSICLRANLAATEKEKLSDEELLAQMSTFILAGMDTSSNALSRTLHLLSQHPSVQSKLRAEIVEARGGPGGDSDIPFDDVMKLPYLDAVCRETLRLHAPVQVSGRTASRDVMLPLSAPVKTKDGSKISELFIPRATTVITNLQASNRNKVLWGKDADEWRPERWLNPLPKALEEAHPRSLLKVAPAYSTDSGFKFSQLEMKIILFTLIPAFSFSLTDKPIAWNTSTVNYPTMGEESTKPEMLLRVSALH